MKVLGLDVSTSIIGYAVLDDSKIVTMGHIDFKNCNNLWEKADKAKKEVDDLLLKHVPDRVLVEESLMGFSSGLSSAGTLFTLAKFNALVSYFVYLKTGQPVEHIAANVARRAVGIKLQQRKKCGLSHKEQAFNWALAGPLAGHEFPKGRTGKYKPYVADEVDGFIVALAGTFLNKPAA